MATSSTDLAGAKLRRSHLRLGSAAARASALRALWSSRAVVLVSGVLGVLAIGRAPHTTGFDPARLTAPFGYFGNLLAAPFARWDSVWYLAIARGGYSGARQKAAFFPLYPLLMRALGVLIGSDLIAGVLISLACFAIALILVYELVSLECGERTARLTVTLIAFCPMAFFFSAVYSESLYLALSAGCILQARRGRWASAALLGGLGAASRDGGVMLLVPFVLLFLYGPRADRQALPRAPGGALSLRRQHPLVRAAASLRPRHPLAPRLLWGLLIPAGLGAFVLYLALATGHGLAPFEAERTWFRHFAGPFGGVWSGAVAAYDGARQLLHGPPPPLYFTSAGGNAIAVAGQNLMLFAFLVLGALALLGAFRVLPPAYGGYCLASLALPLSYPVTPQPLASLPRYEVVLFPLFVWGARWVAARRIAIEAVAVAAVLLGLFTAEFATWRFVA